MLLRLAFLTALSRPALPLAAAASRHTTASSLQTCAMANQQKIAVVTGSNKGIGFEIARALGKQEGFKCIAAARNEERGLLAVRELTEDGANVEFRQLDIDSDESIERFVAGIQSDYGKVDVLVDNAAIAFKASDPTPFQGQTTATFHTNFWQTMKVTDRILPLLSAGSRVVIVASTSGRLNILDKDPEKKAFVTRPDLSREQLHDFINQFCEDVAAGVHQERGWPDTNYGMSKLGIIAYSKVLARERPDLIVNACCPGYVNTDMSSHKGTKSPAEGALTPVLLATSPEVTSSGGFWKDESRIEWEFDH